MKLKEVEQYAIDNDLFYSCKFEIINLGGKTIQFQWIDAYFGLFVQVDKEKDGFIRTESWLKKFGDNYNFRIID